MSRKPAAYSNDELIQALKDRQGGLTIDQFAREIGVSPQLLSWIYLGRRTVSFKVLRYLAPRGKKYVKNVTWYLVDED